MVVQFRLKNSKGESRYMILRKYPIKKEVLLAVGSLSMVISIFLGRYSGLHPIVDFFAGLFTGLALTLNLGFLIRWRMERDAINNSNSQT